MSVTLTTDVFICLALGLLSLAAYCRVCSNDFINWDDDFYVYKNDKTTIGLQWPAVKWAFTTDFLGNWHPLTWLSLQLDNQLFGLDPAGYHATNLLLHVAVTLAVYWMLRNLTGAAVPSASVAALFALHPLHVESVAWVAERKDVLSTLFYILTILAWQRYAVNRSRRAYLVAMVLFTCSLLSKVMGVSLPLVLLLLDFWPLRRLRLRRSAETPDVNAATVRALLIEKLPLVVLCATFSVVAVIFQRRAGAMAFGESLSLIDRWRMVPVNYVTYLAKTFWPVNLAVLYPHPGADLPWWKPIGATLLLVAITAVCLPPRKSRPYLIVGWGWFLVTLLPVIGIVPLGLAATADRYMYLPMVGLLIMACFLAADLVGAQPASKGALATVLAGTLAICGWLTFRQVAVWHDSLTLWEHALAITPPTFISCNDYAQALEQAGRLDEAERWYRKAVQIDPHSFYPNFNLGVIYSNRGDKEAAEHWYRQALEIDPKSAEPNFHLGMILLKKGEHDEAAERFKIALKSLPNDPLVLEDLGVAEELCGHYEAAIDCYKRSARLNPRSPRIREHLRRVLEKQRGS